MESLLLISRSALVLILFYAVYQFFLRNDAHYSINRWFLLLGLITAIILPLIKINYVVIVESINEQAGFIPVQAQSVGASAPHIPEKPDFNWISILPYIYLSISFFLGARVLFNLLKLVKLAYKSVKIKKNGVIICLNPKVDTPFAFANRIFVKDESYLSRDNEQIMVHEMVHLKQRHWLDVMLSELMLVILWFNPFTWAYARLIKQNLEFIADKKVLDEGFRKDEYIQTIISETMGAEVSVLANHFRFSQNKRRLKMMKNDRKSKWRLLKLLMVLPFIGGLLWAFSEPVYELKSGDKPASEIVDQSKKETFIVKGEVLLQEVQAVLDPNTGKSIDKLVGFPLPGTSVVVKGTTNGCVADINGEFELEVTPGDKLVFSFVGMETKEVNVKKEELMIVVMRESAFKLDASLYRKKYKGKMTPPPLPSPTGEKKGELPPPPPPPPSGKDGKPVFYVVENMPSYQGGLETYFATLYTRIEQVKEDADLRGTVDVQFQLSHKGELSNILALNRSNDKEAKYAIQLVSELDQWSPGVQRGKPVRTTLVVPVEFD